VGVIRVGDLTIEVLPKTDKHEKDKQLWQTVLLEMLSVSLQVEAKTTTLANVQIKRHSVLETYLHLFLDEVSRLIHGGLVKKYRVAKGNQGALKGKLLVHKQVTKNIVHAERFYVAHQVYDRNNIFNAVLEQGLYCIQSMSVSDELNKRSSALLLDFPECSPFKIDEKIFKRLVFDRKTERYKTAIELARIILLNYHPDIKGGSNNILAIMFDMNLLWENYVYWILKKASRENPDIKVEAQRKKKFWQHPERGSLRLIPDIVITNKGRKISVVLDTKWKYKKDTSVEDIRQMYTYGHYFGATKSYLLYPDRIEGVAKVKRVQGKFHDYHDDELFQANSCGLMFVDLIEDSHLRKAVGLDIIEQLD
jgi:5-methylcytosine-specific restriction enzyme subunit McrC